MVRWGILGAGNIAKRFAAALAQLDDAALTALSGRSLERLEPLAKEFSVKKCYTSHEALLDDPEVDAIYLALPHDLHKEWALKALEHHKAVLVEKPAVMDAGEMEEIIAVARKNNVLFMEAQKARFTPLYRELKGRLHAGQYGSLLKVETSLCNQMPAAWMRARDTYHYRPRVGGALLDSGTYCANILEDLCPGEPVVVRQEGLTQHGVDVYTMAQLDFGSVTGVLETGFDRQKPRTARLTLEKAEILVEEIHRPTRMVITSPQGCEVVELPYDHDDFYSQIRHFTDLVKAGETDSPIMPMEGSRRIAHILDLLWKNAETYPQVELSPDDLLSADDILRQERELEFDSFSNADAFAIGQEILALVAGRGLKPVRIRVKYRDDIVFQYLMEGKTGEKWLDAKEELVERLGHSTWYAAKKAIEENGEYRQMARSGALQPIGGGFPLRVNGELEGSIIVSGLTDAEDHALVVDALRAHLGKALHS